MLNKQSSVRSAEIVLQNDWSGRAALGLAGGDDFTLKVSADGAAWINALSVRRATGQVNAGKLALSGNLEMEGESWRVAQLSVVAPAA